MTATDESQQQSFKTLFILNNASGLLKHGPLREFALPYRKTLRRTYCCPLKLLR